MSYLHLHLCFYVCLCMTLFINDVLPSVPVDYTRKQEWPNYCARLWVRARVEINKYNYSKFKILGGNKQDIVILVKFFCQGEGQNLHTLWVMTAQKMVISWCNTRVQLVAQDLIYISASPSIIALCHPNILPNRYLEFTAVMQWSWPPQSWQSMSRCKLL
jgi:hypothetical protein